MNATKALRKARKNLLKNQKAMLNKGIKSAVKEGKVMFSLKTTEKYSIEVLDWFAKKGYRMTQFKECIIVSWRKQGC